MPILPVAASFRQVYNSNTSEVFCMSTIVGGGPKHTIILGASFQRAYYVVYAYDAVTNSAEARALPHAQQGHASACLSLVGGSGPCLQGPCAHQWRC